MRQSVLGLVMVGGWALGCGGGGAERAAQHARLATLEEEVRRLHQTLAELKTAAPAGPQPSAAHPPAPFKLQCPQPWLLQAPLGAALWSCRSPSATPEGSFPHCSVVPQAQAEIETKTYFEFALNATPQLHEIKNVKEQRTHVKGAEGFEATFEADLKPLPLKMLSVLMPHGEATFAITCFSPAAHFDALLPSFRKLIDGFEFIKPE